MNSSVRYFTMVGEHEVELRPEDEGVTWFRIHDSKVVSPAAIACEFCGSTRWECDDCANRVDLDLPGDAFTVQPAKEIGER